MTGRQFEALTAPFDVSQILANTQSINLLAEVFLNRYSCWHILSTNVVVSMIEK